MWGYFSYYDPSRGLIHWLRVTKIGYRPTMSDMSPPFTSHIDGLSSGIRNKDV